MATYSSNQKTTQGLVDPILVLISVALIGILAVFGPLNGRMYGSSHRALVAQAGSVGEVSLKAGTSFVSNLHYWNTTCKHGWTSNSTCDALAAATQICVVGIRTESVYCSEYATYLKQVQTNK